MQKGFTIWLTGLPASGKTTVGRLVQEELQRRGKNSELLDGDEIRKNLSKGLGYSKDDRNTHIRRIGYVAHLLTRNGVGVICTVISPYRAIRDEVRRQIGGHFIEVHMRASPEACAKRDKKGLYKKAYAGEIKQFTGVSDPYEAPQNPEIVCNTEKETPSESAALIIAFLEKRGLIASAPVYSAEEEAEINRRLRELGYL